MTRGDSIIRFGADGWQARFDGGFTEENIVRLTEAIGLCWADNYPGRTVCVGFDTRYNAQEHARLVAGVLSASGLKPIVADRPTPTPAIAWMCARNDKAIGAVIITASKRSCEYGGMLIRCFDGSECSRAFLEKVEDLVSIRPTLERNTFSEQDLLNPYLEDLAYYADGASLQNAGLKLVVDPMYGSAKGVLSGLLTRLGCEVLEIHGEDSADFGNLHPEPCDPWADACQRAVVSSGATMGLLLDGDGDRSAVVDETGRLLTPQEHVALALLQLVEGRGQMGRVVTTLSTSALVSRQARALGLPTTAVPVGFSRLYREIAVGDVILAAEEYGGISFPPHLNERDGLLASLLTVELVARTGKTLSQLVRELEEQVGRLCYARRDIHMDAASIQWLRNILPGVNPETLVNKKPVEVNHSDGLRLDFEDGSWALVRPSRTDTEVRIYAEASSEHERDALMDEAQELIKRRV